MNKGLYIARKNYLYTLIRELSRKCGDDNVEWLKEHLQQTLEAYPDERIEIPIKCYKDLLDKWEAYQ